ncbi:hypothetical protein [Stutzerimonas stutzeri]|jgi:hypothetical protein|uniref:hypothetical protein n=1 Tax=Stutzerimonas stutzeri TaxID=316 RepID=UPI00210D5AB7|nr:hypothetical protein [Stutzerimonas stutzeri]MCQ4259140.1 hypothetical protein [Stutzerimonas stutzeri]
MNEQHELRRFTSLRKHVDELLSEGAVITDRDPTTLVFEGQALKARHGMLVGHADTDEASKPARD